MSDYEIFSFGQGFVRVSGYKVYPAYERLFFMVYWYYLLKFGVAKIVSKFLNSSVLD